MHRLAKTTLLATALLLPAGVLLAQEADESPEDLAVEMRQGHMLNFAHNLMALGAMAQEKTAYDAATATAAAENLSHLAAIHWDYYWPEGTSNADRQDTGALPAIWENMDDFNAKHEALQQAVANLQTAAGTDLASLQGAMGDVGKACGGCHETYRAKEE
ncbi:cytochrome c-554 [Rubellimicrobium mesophilum DSM 19309]|uniref:Cytochrome c-554 n=1 Tax=Rubellimicrobium mesophilum DSM 19309 TaxID=442562 RepID=A0A017HGH4_9RHOB|nr:cytochrome c [Rubellimicrobium mesophilum]EYD73562.1 cytochrome c-554 [Rubellimicrobium mesophilum DSM 19309]